MRKALESFQRFAEIVLNKSTGADLKHLIADIQAYNEDPENGESLPWIFISSQGGDGLAPSEIDEILAQAKLQGMGDEFRLTSSGGLQVLAFTHEGRPLAESICNRMGLAYSNLLGCGLVVDDMIILSPYLSTDQRIKRELDVVEMMLGNRNA